MHNNTVTVKELIEILTQFPEDMTVVTHGIKEGFENILYPEIISVYIDEDSMPEYEGLYSLAKSAGQKPVDVLAIFRDER